MHVYISNQFAADTACKSVSSTFQSDSSAGVGTSPTPSSAPPHSTSVSVATDSASADSPISAGSPLIAVDSSLATSAGLDLVVDLSSYPLQPNILWPSSSPASPPLINKHPMVLRPR